MSTSRYWNLILLAAATVVATGCASSPNEPIEPSWASNADIEVEAAQQFAEMKASMPLITDRDTIDYIACVANAVVNVRYSTSSIAQGAAELFAYGTAVRVE